jgi:hypothetical protein
MANPTPPSSASAFYKALHATTIEFIRAQDQDVSTPNRMDFDRIKAIRSTTGFEHSWGHNYLVSTNLPMSGTHDADSFIKHLGSMIPLLESWDTEITDIAIDELQRKAVVRGSYFMKPKGSPEAVENDLVWYLTMEEDGKKVQKSIEFLDGAAVQRMKELMMMGKN